MRRLWNQIDPRGRRSFKIVAALVLAVLLGAMVAFALGAWPIGVICLLVAFPSLAMVGVVLLVEYWSWYGTGE